MFASRSSVLALALGLVTLLALAGSASAQTGAPNPSGGHGLRQTVEEGGGSGGPADIRVAWSEFGLRVWLARAAAWQSLRWAAAHPAAGWSRLAVRSRQVWLR
jgi:hypothetical protein